MEKTIKSFIYLDDYKLYSLSSQLFEGFSEYIISESAISFSEEEKQKGNFASGKVMGDLLRQEKSSTEKRFLHDYAFNLLEKELIEQKILHIISETDSNDIIQSKGIIKVKGRAVFNDYKVLQNTITNFNKIGESMGYFQYGKNLELLESLNKENNIKDRNQLSKVKQITKSLEKKINDILIENGLRLPDNDLKHMANLMEYGFHGELEFRIHPKNLNIQLSAILNREYLRDREIQFVSKYSRQTEYEFTMVGIVTQSGKKINFLPEHDPNGIKDACLILADKLNIMENTFMGRLDNECIIDPIAIYREL